MERIEIDLKHCYGIKSLKQTVDFSTGRAKALYAPNGVMKWVWLFWNRENRPFSQ